MKKDLPCLKHIALIPDGMRRWACKNGVTYREAYDRMVDKLAEYTQLFFEHEEVNTVSLFLSSIRTMKRDPTEVQAYCEAESTLCSKLLPPVVDRFHVRVAVAGKKSILPKYLYRASDQLEQSTRDNKERYLYLGLAYDPWSEIEMMVEKHDTTKKIIEKLWIPKPVSVMIRTGKGNAVSSFLPLQSAGSAWIYDIDKLFLDTTEEDIKDVFSSHKDSKLANRVESIDDLLR